MPIIREMNQRLKDEMNNRTFFRRFGANLEQLQQLACEIVAQSGLTVTPPFGGSKNTLVRPDAFEHIFESLNVVETQSLAEAV